MELLYVAFLLVAAATASPADQNTTATSDSDTQLTGRLGWVAPGGERSTWGIILSCLSVFVICSWKCTHLNIPSPAESEAGWHKAWGVVPYFPEAGLRAKWGRKMAWMALISIAPELVVSIAFEQFIEARRALKAVGSKYTMTHAFFANMGGFALVATEPAQAVDTDETDETDESAPVLPHRSEQVGQVIVKERFLTLENFAMLQTEDFHLRVSEYDIKDRSKANALTKTLALCQSGWLVVQIIARVVRGLAITELELSTMAFVFCATITYALWWNKPFDADRGYLVVRSDADFARIKARLKHLTDANESWYERNSSAFDASISVGPLESRTGRVADLGVKLSEIPVIFIINGVAGRTWPVIVLCLVGAAFNAIHLAAWNWDFPSPLVQMLWRTFAAAALLAALLPLLPMWLVSILIEDDDEDKYANDICSVVGASSMLLSYGLLFVCAVSRVGLLVLIFYCFSSMPASVYEPLDWAAFLPHIS